jgi:hypothetical protein
MSKKSPNLEQSMVETSEEKQPKEVIPSPETELAKPEKPLTLGAIHKELNDLRKLVLDYGQQVTSLQDSLVRKLLSKNKYCLKLRELG